MVKFPDEIIKESEQDAQNKRENPSRRK